VESERPDIANAKGETDLLERWRIAEWKSWNRSAVRQRALNNEIIAAKTALLSGP
jgi:hypothetical protein